jgi:filamentous hemagglutinin family protein
MKSSAIASALAGLMLALPAAAQVVLDGSVGSAGPGLVPGGTDDLGQPATYLIQDDLGEQSGSNLFHSFSRFDVGTGETATFMSTSPTPIDRVLSRVTGGSQSEIYGTLRSTIPGADLYLMNPAGVLFGEGSSLDVPGSLHVTTGDYLRHADAAGTRFPATATPPTALSTAPIAAFGFLDDDVGRITVLNTTLELGAGETLSLVGGNIEIVGSDIPAGEGPDTLRVPSGRVDLASVASSGEVRSSGTIGDPELDVDEFEQLGQIALTDSAAVLTKGDPGGVIVIRAGEFVLERQSSLSSTTTGDAHHPGIGIDVAVRGAVIVDDGEISSSNQGDGNAGDIEIHATHLEVGDDPGSELFQGNIGARIFEDEAGAPGNGEEAISGAGGDVYIEVETLRVRDSGFIANQAFENTSGETGDIRIVADEVEITDRGWVGTGTTGGAGAVGDIDVTATRVEARDGGTITSWTWSPYEEATAGNVTVLADEVRISNAANAIPTGIQSYTLGRGNGGDVTVRAPSIRIENGGEISAYTTWIDTHLAGFGETGDGGHILVEADELVLTGFSGPGLEDPFFTASGIFATTVSGTTGDAGSMTLNVRNIELSNFGRIGGFAGYQSAGGNAGLTEINAETIRMSGGAAITNSTYALGLDLWLNPAPAGDGGDIRIRTGLLEASERSFITSESWGPGNGGLIDVEADEIRLLSGASISGVATFSPWATGYGDGGSLRIRAGSFLAQGSGLATNIDPGTGEPVDILPRVPSGLSVEGVLGAPGSIDIVADELSLLDGAQIRSNTLGPNPGGSINILADHVTIAGESPELRDDPVHSSFAGIFADSAAATISGFDFAATEKAGDIALRGTDGARGKKLSLDDGGEISSGTGTIGDGGSISFDFNRISLRNGSEVSVRSTATASDVPEGETPGLAGNILIDAGETLKLRRSSITAESVASDGGNIDIHAGQGVELVESSITAEVGGGPDTTGGNVTIDPDWVILEDDSRILANAFEGQGGNISISTKGLFVSADSDIDASSEFGVSGTVNVNAPDTNLSGSLAPLSDRYLEEVRLRRERCAELGAEDAGSFVLGTGAGVPEIPDAPLPSLPLELGPDQNDPGSSTEETED